MRHRSLIAIKTALWIGVLAPIPWEVWLAVTNNLGANPQRALEHFTGSGILYLLFATLAITPLRRLTGWNDLIRFRRLLGLFAFFYGCLHLLTYVWFDQDFNGPAIVHDVEKHHFILVGLLGWTLLIPLAMTSTNGWIRRLGGRRWALLHRLVYAALALGIVHYYWMQKADHSAPILAALGLALLLAARPATAWLQTRRKAQSLKNTPALAEIDTGR